MHILQICNKSPFPPKEGGSIAMNAITQVLLSTNCKVKAIAISTPKLDVNKLNIPLSYINQTSFEHCFIDTDVKILPALKCLITGKSYNVKRFISDNFSSFLKDILKKNKYDVIQLETIYVAPYLELIRNTSPESVVVLRAHNVEHLIWERNAKYETNILKKFYIKHLAKTLKKYETNIFNKFDGIACISDVDNVIIKKYAEKTNVKTIPFNISDSFINKEVKDFAKRHISLFHIGSMDWIPNIEGVKWFLNNVWKLLKEQNSNISFELAGRNMPQWIYDISDERIIVHGEVENAFDFMGNGQIMIVPLLSGSGVRIKIIEGMAAGNVVITTSIGAEGIACTHKKNILIADTPNDFVENIIWCIDNKEKLKEISDNARKFVLLNHSKQAVAENITAFYKELIANKRSKD